MIKFTQYLRPDGRKAEVEITRPSEVEEKAHRLQSLGWTFSTEVLNTGVVALYAEKGEDKTVTELVTNGPDVPVAVDKLIDDAVLLEAA
jgi:hypothetical protein